MQPCSKNRKLIAWLALGMLEGREAAELREHISTCEGCRRYSEEIANVAARLEAAEPDSDLKASDFFHRRVAGKLRAVESSSLVERLAERVRGAMPNWRVALPAMAVLALALLVMTASQHYTAPFAPATPVAQGLPAAGADSDLAPTLANYQMIANQSLDKLSDLLTRQGNRNLPAAPVYTASSFQTANGSF
jgi:negative regulator of sigma E activity